MGRIKEQNKVQAIKDMFRRNEKILIGIKQEEKQWKANHTEIS